MSFCIILIISIIAFSILVIITHLVETILAKSILEGYSYAYHELRDLISVCYSFEKRQKCEELVSKIEMQLRLLKFIEKLKIVNFKSLSMDSFLEQIKRKRSLYYREVKKVKSHMICVIS